VTIIAGKAQVNGAQAQSDGHFFSFAYERYGASQQLGDEYLAHCSWQRKNGNGFDGSVE
jgi:hypothetical protein